MGIISGPPFYRFYAGMPIRTRAGLNIGSLAIMDDQPREGLSLAEEDFMRITVEQIMILMETNRQAIENIRMRKMMDGLTRFVARSNTDYEHVTRQQQQPSLAPGESELSIQDVYNIATPMQDVEKNLLSSDLVRRAHSHPPYSTVSSKRFCRSKDSQVFSSTPNPSIPDAQVTMAESKKDLLRRAGIEIRKSLSLSELSPVVFFRIDNLHTRDLSSTVLVTEPDCTLDLSFLSLSGQNNIDLDHICKLSRQFPRGCIWNSTSGVCSINEHARDSQHNEKTPEPLDSDVVFNSMKDIFTSASQLIFMPIKNAHSSRPTFCLFIPSSEGDHVFDAKTDLNFLRVFCNTISTTISQIDAQEVDRQKNDFVGNISHEMRSPLHGILSSTHFLVDSDLTDFQRTMIDTMESCSATLLDTVDHILDYSKINTFERRWSTLVSNTHPENPATVGGEENSKTNPKIPPLLLNLNAVTDISAVLEQVVEHLVFGHIYHKSVDITDLSREACAKTFFSTSGRDISTSKSVLILPETRLNIGKADWVFATQPGAIRRVISNLVGNALKYTPDGCIDISLTQRSSDSDQRLDMVTLRITDTGFGMSQDFLESEVFLPFSQENHLSPGTGLGLSIVHSIVKMMNGTIEYQSSVGEGTTVEVNLPLLRPNSDQLSANQTPVQASPGNKTRADLPVYSQALAGLTFCYHESIVAERKPLRQVLDSYFTGWMDFAVTTDWQSASVVVIMIDDLQDFISGLRGTKRSMPAVLVLYEVGSTHRLGSSYDSIANNLLTAQFVSLPCGPHKLWRAIRTVIGRRNVKSASEVELSPSTTMAKNAGGVSQQSVAHRKDIIPNTTKKLRSDVSELRGITPNQTSRHGNSEDCTPLVSPSFDSSESTSDALNAFPFPSQSDRLASASHGSATDLSGLSDTVAQPDTNQLSCFRVLSPRKSSLSSSTDPRVLIVDDNAINLRLLETFLRKRRNYTKITKATNGREAVDLFASAASSESGYELVFMDISMPVMNGFEATRQIREFESSTRSSQVCRTKHEKVEPLSPGRLSTKRAGALIVALTGLASGKDQAGGFECGLDVYMTKPANFKDISRFLDTWQSHRREADEVS